jgi:GH25 family lysozyme M1 (1,4-beta-N-acetylmuramidase)
MAGTSPSPSPASAGGGSPLSATAGAVQGHDVSSRQGSGVDWGQSASHGAQFAYVKATEGSYYTNPDFARDYRGAARAGIIRGAYVLAIPSDSSGASQADHFVSHGGGWSADGRTLPGMLDMEGNPYGTECYGLSQSAMVSWIRGFVNEYHARTGRWAVIYTSYRWWRSCTGDYAGFAGNDPLWIANYASGAGRLPAGWSSYTFWQYAETGTFPGDQDVFNGPADRLLALANNT